MTKEIWKKINGKLVNPRYVIADNYEVSNFGKIRNTKTGNILNGYIPYNKNNRYITLFCKNGMRANFVITNIVTATFNNINTFGKH